MKRIIEETIKNIDRKRYEEFNGDIPNFCKYMAETIGKLKADVLLNLISLPDSEFRERVCNSNKRPYFCLNDENYFLEKLYYEYISNPAYTDSKDYKRKFLFHNDYKKELEWTKQNLKNCLPRIGVIITDENGEDFRFAMNCPKCDSDVCIYNEKYAKLTYKDLIKKENITEDIL
ncbi:MAG: hypothetical protein GYA14_14165 [Ignavibacteria bacterium]|nr:hypothetical protein [Ignavibacteria bacterium]